MKRALAILVLSALPVRAAESVVAGLSQSQISITANFDGSELLIFGAVKREEAIPTGSDLDVIITVEGPSTPLVVRRKARAYGVWINMASVEIDQAPSFYSVETTRPFHDIVSKTEDLRRKISVPQMIRSVGAPPTIDDSPAFTEALIRIREGSGAYSMHEGSVTLVEETLFKTQIQLPANLVEGDYRARFFLLRDNRVIATKEEIIDVRKVGLERWLYDMSRDAPAAFGIMSLSIAALAGWAASALFRLLRNG